MVFILNKNKQPLSPCSEVVARRLLDNGKAVVHKLYPFTIRLKELKSSEDKSEYRLKIDYGSRHTGLAILRNSDVIWLGILHHKTMIKANLDNRRSLRRGRRNRHTRYRSARFDNRRRQEGWLSPSLQSRVDNIMNILKKLRRLCPITHISYENVKFDTQLMQNAEISGVEYQQGTLKGYEVREYLLEKWGRKCAYCSAENVPLEIEHIVPKSRGGTNRISNLTLSCESCNKNKGTQTAEEFGHREIQAQAKKPLKDATLVTSTRWTLYNALLATELPVECGTGGRTKFNRTNLELPKDHHFDAICVGSSTPEKVAFKTNQVLNIRARGRGLRQRSIVKKGFPYGKPKERHKCFFGFQTGDMVKVVVPNKAKNKYAGHTFIGAASCNSTKSGTFDIKNKEGKKIVKGINHKYIELSQRSDGYEYTIDKLLM